MFDRYTEDARMVIFLARYEASLLGSATLEPEHLWLGVLRQSKKLVKRHAPRVTTEAVQEKLILRGVNGERVSMTVEIPLSQEARRAIEGAALEANSHGQKHITAEHLLLALLRLETDTGA